MGFFFICAAMLSGCTQTSKKQPFTPGYRSAVAPLDNYDPETEVTFSGTVVEVSKKIASPPVEGMDLAEGKESDMSLVTVLIASQGEEKIDYVVQLGPAWYLDFKKVRLRKGNRVSVVGSRLEFDYEPADPEDSYTSTGGVILARKLDWEKRTVTFRNGKGFPLWFKAARARGFMLNWRTQIGKSPQRRMQRQQLERNRGYRSFPSGP